LDLYQEIDDAEEMIPIHYCTIRAGNRVQRRSGGPKNPDVHFTSSFPFFFVLFCFSFEKVKRIRVDNRNENSKGERPRPLAVWRPTGSAATQAD